MRSQIKFGLFVAMALLQLAAPASMILSHERTLAAGAAYKFRTAPVDPYDAFRGRYVALSFERSEAKLAAGVSASPGQTVYATLEISDDGFAKFGVAALAPPKDLPYLKVKAGYSSGDGAINLQLPFDRFYMEETKAPAAEAAYRAHNRQGAQDAYVVVRVRDGGGVIEDLYVGGKPIRDAWRETKP
jgi:uncharacterized membrane-anchored protein